MQKGSPFKHKKVNKRLSKNEIYDIKFSFFDNPFSMITAYGVNPHLL